MFLLLYFWECIFWTITYIVFMMVIKPQQKYFLFIKGGGRGKGAAIKEKTFFYLLLWLNILFKKPYRNILIQVYMWNIVVCQKSICLLNWFVKNLAISVETFREGKTLLKSVSGYFKTEKKFIKLMDRPLKKLFFVFPLVWLECF